MTLPEREYYKCMTFNECSKGDSIHCRQKQDNITTITIQ